MKPLTANDPETKTPDVVAENVEQLKTIFPEAFTEGKVDFEVLKQLLGGAVEEREEKYGLNWHGKRRARQLALTPSTGTLRPCPDESVDWDATRNLMIEGDNLEVLKLLQKSYSGKVKLIYIDPPYNTGKDFVYPDDFRDNIKNYLELTGQTDGEGRKRSSNTEASGRFHTDWLNMMYPRLKLARNLLREDGAVFISIDDSEVANLGELCDEVFGEENFIANVIWEKKFAPQNDEKYFSERHDFVLVFAKSKEIWSRNLLPRSEEATARYKNPDNDPHGPWASSDLLRIEHRDNCVYTITSPSGIEWTPDPGTSWRHPENEMLDLIRTGQVSFGADGTSKPRRKRYLSDVSDGVVPETMWFHKDCGHNQEATQETKSLFSDVGIPFSNPKPTRLIRRVALIASSANTDDLVLDFFAGSGSTGHAILAQNSSDGGNRRYILVQLPEVLDQSVKEQQFAAECCAKLGKPRNIAELTKERLRRAGKKVREENPMFAGDLGFRVFKLASSNIRAWEPNRDDLPTTLHDSIEHLKTDRTEQDILFELLLKLGLDLTIPIEQKSIAGKAVHNIGAGTLRQALKDGTLQLPEQFQAQLPQIKEVLRKLAGKLDIKNADERRPIKARQAILHGEEFKALWDRIKHKTTYRVQFDNEKLLKDCAEAIRKSPQITKTRVQIRIADLAIGRGGVLSEETRVAAPIIIDETDIELPDLLTDLQDKTQLTRRSIAKIAERS